MTESPNDLAVFKFVNQHEHFGMARWTGFRAQLNTIQNTALVWLLVWLVVKLAGGSPLTCWMILGGLPFAVLFSANGGPALAESYPPPNKPLKVILD
jgi:uncharacterized membrane protein